MVSGINAVSNVSFAGKSQNDKCFVKGGCKVVCIPESELLELRRPKESKFNKMAKAAGRNFVAGAVISAVFDGVISGFNAINKNKAGVMKAKHIAQRAGIWGLCWVAASAALSLVFPNRYND